MASILKEWVQELGLRHQGTLLAGVRGCDDAPPDDPGKRFCRCYRETILHAHCGDAAKSASFIELCKPAEVERRFDAFRKVCDVYPWHYVTHVLSCLQIVGYKHPDPGVRRMWHAFYLRMCKGLHVMPESCAAMDARLDVDESSFAAGKDARRDPALQAVCARCGGEGACLEPRGWKFACPDCAGTGLPAAAGEPAA